jgi:uncharacterized membrane protein YqjE
MDKEAEPAQPRGFRDAASGTLKSGTSLARARIELLRLEVDEAQERLVAVSRFAVVGIVLFTVGYGLLASALTHLAAEKWLSGNWQIPLCAVALLHLFAGGVLLFAYRSRLRRSRFFGATLDQFDRDREWLNALQNDLTKRN